MNYICVLLSLLLILRIPFLLLLMTNKKDGAYSIKESNIKRLVQTSLEPIYDDFPHLRNAVADLIQYESKRFIVFVDHENDLDWEVTDDFEQKMREGNKGLQAVLAGVDVLGHQASIRYFSEKTKQALMWHLGRSVVLALNGYEDLAQQMLDKARKFSFEQTSEITRKWQLTYAFIIYVVVLVIFLVALFIEWVFDYTVGDVIPSIFYGCTGVMLSSIQMSGKMHFDCGSGKWLHFLQVASKYVAGGIGSCFLIALYQSGMLFQNVQDTANGNGILFVLGTLGGFSERMVPSLLERFTMEGDFRSEEGNSAAGKSGRSR